MEGGTYYYYIGTEEELEEKGNNKEGETKQEQGTVLKDNKENEYVWIPVNDAIYDGVTEYPTGTGNAGTRTYKPMAIKQQGYDNYYESIIYTYNGILSYRNTNNTGIGKTSYREPSLVTNNPDDGYTWNITNPKGNAYDVAEGNYKTILGFENSQKYGEYMASSYNNMITAVDTYGGYYVGRYETSLFTEEGTNSRNGTVAKSVIGEQPMSGIDWYKMYLTQDSNYEKNPYYTSTSVTSNMITGSQYDAILNYILKGTDKEKVTSVTGNHTGKREETGEFGNDIMNNIFDLSSNAREWTTEGNSYMYRVSYGGYNSSVNTSLTSSYTNGSPTYTGGTMGSRLSLYIK